MPLDMTQSALSRSGSGIVWRWGAVRVFAGSAQGHPHSFPLPAQSRLVGVVVDHPWLGPLVRHSSHALRLGRVTA